MGRREPSRVLEIGCGSGLVLEQLAGQWPHATFLGLDAAATPTRHNVGDRVSIKQCLLEEMPPTPPGFDLVFAINVIEHAFDPQRFLAAIVAQLRRTSLCILVCPAADPPNTDLLIFDHVHTFTVDALGSVAKKAGIRLLGRFVTDLPIGDFQVLLLERTEGVAQRENFTLQGPADESAGETLTRKRADYLSQWARLDAELCKRTAAIKHLVAFGAGEIAALIRSYAPAVWSKIEFLTVDDHYSSRNLGKPVMVYPKGIDSKETAILLAVNPCNQEGLAARLRNDRKLPITWHDLVSR